MINSNMSTILSPANSLRPLNARIIPSSRHVDHFLILSLMIHVHYLTLVIIGDYYIVVTTTGLMEALHDHNKSGQT